MSQFRRTKQLLLLNTNRERLTSLEKLLTEKTDLKILPAYTTQVAIDTLKTQSVDYIVSNINLDNFDGWRLARMVRSGVLKCSSETPFIIVANTWCEHIARTTAREFGINKLIAFSECEQLPSILNNDDYLPVSDMKKSSLLVIEDNEDTRQLVTRILSTRFNIDTAEDGEQGLIQWREKNYDLVLLDVMLPGMSGNNVLDVMMQEQPSQSVVIMTANHTMELAEELMLNGAADFVTKPFRAEQLRGVCESAARREDFIISNKQFASKVKSLNESRAQYRNISEQHQHLLDQLGSVIIELNEQGEICFLNKAWEKFTGYTIDESNQKSLLDFIEKPSSPGAYISNEVKTLLSGKTSSHSFEFRLKNKFNEELWVEAKFDVNLSDKEQNRYISGTIDNVTSRKKAQKDLEYLAMHDGLTGLYNRVYFENELKQYSATAARGHGPHALFYLDLDRFKVINDTLGHHHGDVVLRNISSLIQSRIREADFIARIGGDEFALLLPNTDMQTALKLATNICQLLDSYKCEIEEQIFKVNCSIGVAEINGSEFSAQDYMKHADIALYAAKKMGRNTAHLYNQNDILSKELQASLEWARTLHQAVADDNLILHFQPIYHIATREIAYYEALVRLELDGKLIMPGEFIPALEREGDMSLLDRQVISKAIYYLAEHSGLNKIAINLSAQGFSDERLIPLLQEKLQQYQIDANRIIFELTESASLTNIAATQKIIEQLSELGCEFSIDDFGTGFSTFTYLKQLPAQSVKIDGSFIVDLANNSVDLALVKAICEVASALNKRTVAEFVENEETLNILADIGVTYAQGYHLCKPQPVEGLF
ncbi:GGDEF domain-containing response regulator [Litorilituus lipolyticus]|uniref:EAL domain-containing protein n=1 Tax=Litorilituus lipolyticus TaxID=2491017 RepID=A0A502L2B3_9GAMM|nr:GGDEF domain-containing response regulator [Litorilituus lipolyticus]TPH18048.1 EAL domain-containing protein [Litorilituus lipolyticus]